MKKIVSSVTFRAVIGTALCITFIIYPQVRVSAGEVGAPYAAIDLKSESQVKAEASSYERAIRAIAAIATMKLDTPDDLKQALAILEREGPNLKFHRSKLTVLCLNETTFSSAIKKRSPDKQTAEALIKELSADPKAVLKLEGAEALKTRMEQSTQTDAATLRRVAERLKEAAGKIKRTSQGRVPPGFATSDEFKLVQAGFSASKQPETALYAAVMPQDPATIFVIIVAVVFYAEVAVIGVSILKNVSTEEGRDRVAECLEVVNDRRVRCVTAARNQPFPVNIGAEAECDSVWLFTSADCLIL
jgi:hypothetical protein